MRNKLNYSENGATVFYHSSSVFVNFMCIFGGILAGADKMYTLNFEPIKRNQISIDHSDRCMAGKIQDDLYFIHLLLFFKHAHFN